MAQLRAWANNADTAATASFPPKLRYRPRTGELQFVPPGARDSDAITLLVGTKVIPDWRRFFEGELCYKPYDDSRLVLRGQPVPPRSGDEDYDGAIKIDVLVQRFGLAVLSSTSANMIQALDQLHDAYVVAPEAVLGQLPLYRIDEPRSYVSRYTGDLLYVPVWSLVGWVERGSGRFGKPLIPAPRPVQDVDAIPAPTASLNGDDGIFDTAAHTGAVLSSQPKKPVSARKGTSGSLVHAGDLDDEIPF